MNEDILKDSWMPDEPVSKTIKNKIKADNGRFWAGDNISKYLEEGDKQKLIEELTPKFESVLDSVERLGFNRTSSKFNFGSLSILI